MRWLMKLLGFGKMADSAYLDFLRKYCEACSGNDIPALMQHEALARKLGQSLHQIGGLAEMRRIFDLLGPIQNLRRLETLWDGTGEWQARTLPGPLSERSEDKGEVIRGSIRIDGKSVQVEFFDGILCTGEERDDQVSNFDLSIRFSEPVLIQAVVKNVTVRIPWKPDPVVLGILGYGDAPGGLDVTMHTEWPPEALASTAPDVSEGRRLNAQVLPKWFEVFWAEHSESQPLGRLTIKTSP